MDRRCEVKGGVRVETSVQKLEELKMLRCSLEETRLKTRLSFCRC